MEENIYYYAFFRNNTNVDVKAEYAESRTQAIVNDLSKYKMAVLSLDFGNIDAPYFLSSEKQMTFQLEYVPDGLISTQTLFAGVEVEIKLYEELLEEYNRLLVVAWNDLKAQYEAIYGVGTWTYKVPGITFAPEDNLFTTWMDENNEEGGANEVVWSSDLDLMRLFQGMEMVGNRFKFVKKFNNTNVKSGYIKNTQQYSTGSNWSTLREILVTTHRLGCRKEYIGGRQDNSQAIIRDVIGNYPVSITNNEGGLNPGSRIIIYNLVGTPRWIDIFGDAELYDIDFKLLYLTSTGRAVPVKIKPGQSFGIKVMFVRK